MLTRHEFIKEINSVSDNCCHCVEAVRGAWIERVMSHDYEQRQRIEHLEQYCLKLEQQIMNIHAAFDSGDKKRIESALDQTLNII